MNPRIRDWRGRRVWLVGASSGIGEGLARALSACGAELALSARRADELERLSAELGNARSLPLDVTSPEAIAKACEALYSSWGRIDLAIYLAGAYQPMDIEHFDGAAAQRMLAINFVGAMSFAAALAPRLLQQGAGQIAMVSSVAAYRGMPKALVYGPSKAALSHFAECLYLDLAPRGVGVRLISPGFVSTPMTAQNDFHMPALIHPEVAAREIIAGLATRAFELHFPKRFTWLMKLLSLMPHRLYVAMVRQITGL